MLLSILHQLPAPDPALAVARQRSLAKAAIALARVSLEQATADAALRLGALDTLARLATREGQGETVREVILKTSMWYHEIEIEMNSSNCQHIVFGRCQFATFFLHIIIITCLVNTITIM